MFSFSTNKNAKIKFLALNLSDNQEYAIKIYNKQRLLRNRTIRKGLQLDAVYQEICILATLSSHPNIVHIHEVIDDSSDEKIFIGKEQTNLIEFFAFLIFFFFKFPKVLEYGNGGNLMMGHGMEDLQPLPDPVQSKNYFKDVLTGLAYMHSHNIIHRDIKPENLLLCDGIVKVSDFSVSILLSDSNKKQLR